MVGHNKNCQCCLAVNITLCRYENYCREHISHEKRAERLQNLARQEFDVSSTADAEHVTRIYLLIQYLLLYSLD